MKYARLSPDNIVVEIFSPPTGFTIEQCFHPLIAAQFEFCPDEVGQNWIRNPDGTYTEPAPIPEPEPPVVNPTNP